MTSLHLKGNAADAEIKYFAVNNICALNVVLRTLKVFRSTSQKCDQIGMGGKRMNKGDGLLEKTGTQKAFANFSKFNL